MSGFDSLKTLGKTFLSDLLNALSVTPLAIPYGLQGRQGVKDGGFSRVVLDDESVQRMDLTLQVLG